MSPKFDPSRMTTAEKQLKIEKALKRLRLSKKGSFALILVAIGIGAMNVHLFLGGKSTLVHALVPSLILLILAVGCYSICGRIITNVEAFRTRGGG
jgi:hypothetical protein